MKAFHNNPAIQKKYIERVQHHFEFDEIVKGQYWQKGKGCAVGCTVHSNRHGDFETELGIPIALAYLEDSIFEGLPNGDAKEFPRRFLAAIPLGADLSRVSWQFLHWLLTASEIGDFNDPLVKPVVASCAAVLEPLMRGEQADKSAARSAWSAAWSAESAAESAWSAAWSAESARSAAESAAESAARNARSAARSAESAARSAESAAESAAWSAESAARSAESAAESAAWSAESAARSAESAAESAAWSAESAARSAAWSAAYVKMADKLVQLLSNA